MTTTKFEPTLFAEIQKRGIPYDSHASDLYIPVTSETSELIRLWDYRPNVTTFVSAIDGKLWYDIPFAYSPWWEARQGHSFAV